MNLVNGQAYLNLDAHLDLVGLDKIQDSITLAVARSAKARVVGRAGITACLLDQSRPDISDLTQRIMVDANNPDHQFLRANDVNFEDTMRYLRLKYPSGHLNEVIYIRGYKGWDDVLSQRNQISAKLNSSYFKKHLASETEETEVARFFQPFLSWVKGSEAFSEVGRVIVFLTNRGEYSEIHRDYPFNLSQDQFLWLNFSDARKKFFVYDEVNRQKHYIDCQAAYFDNSNFHGSDPVGVDSFSIRVDGIFSNAFMSKIGLRI